MSYGYIYKLSTTCSDKVYIGQTTLTVNERFNQHKKNYTQQAKSSLHLYLAMAKYGPETFSVEQIDTANSQNELNEKERYWIDYYDSINNGYNMMAGGNDENPMNSMIVKQKHDEKMRTPEVRSKISETMHILRTTQGFSLEHKQRIKESRAKRKAERAARGLGFYDHPEHMANASIKVGCILDTGEQYEFDSILEGGRWWYANYKPFGERYSVPTFQRKIEASMRGEQIKFTTLTAPRTTIYVNNIKWYKVETSEGRDVNE